MIERKGTSEVAVAATEAAKGALIKMREPASNKLMRYGIYGGVGSLGLIYGGLAAGALTAATIGGILLPIAAGVAVVGALVSTFRKRKNFTK